MMIAAPCGAGFTNPPPRVTHPTPTGPLHPREERRESTRMVARPDATQTESETAKLPRGSDAKPRVWTTRVHTAGLPKLLWSNDRIVARERSSMVSRAVGGPASPQSSSNPQPEPPNRSRPGAGRLRRRLPAARSARAHSSARSAARRVELTRGPLCLRRSRPLTSHRELRPEARRCVSQLCVCPHSRGDSGRRSEA